MLFQTILVEKEVFKGLFHRGSKNQQIHGESDVIRHKQGGSAKFRGFFASCCKLISS